MEVSGRLYNTFLEDGKTFTANIRHLLMKSSSRPGSCELVKQLLRNTHSLKSEADYIGIGEVTSIAHGMESELQDRLNRRSSLDTAAARSLLLSNDRIEEVFDFLISRQEEKGGGKEKGDSPGYDISGEALKKSGSGSGSEEKESKEEKASVYQDLVHTSLPDFAPFEIELLRAARGRGERLYRLSLVIAEDAPMPFAKAYLLLSNLEQTANVIRTVPRFVPDQPPENPEELRRIAVFLTTDGETGRMYDAVHIDQVSGIRLTPVSYLSILEEPEKEEGMQLIESGKSIRIEPELLNRLSGYIDELKITTYQMRRKQKREEKRNPKEELGELEKLVDGLEKISKAMSKVRLKELFSGYPDYISSMSVQLGKKVHFELIGAEINVDRRIAEILGETVLHLVRNALDHGIESSEERLSRGKSEAGTIRLEIRREDGGLVLTVADDGRGVDMAELHSTLEESDWSGTETEGPGGGRANELAALLARPGFTTRQEASEYSGRGFGLDIVYRKIGRIEGALLEAETEKGRGTSFSITIPGGVSFLTLKMIRWEKMILAVPERSILSVEHASQGTWGGDAQGRLEWKGIPVFSPEGRLYRTDHLPPQENLLLIQHLDKRGVLPADELLFTREVPEEQFTLFVEESPFLYRSSLGGRKSGFYYLSPSVVAIE